MMYSIVLAILNNNKPVDGNFTWKLETGPSFRVIAARSWQSDLNWRNAFQTVCVLDSRDAIPTPPPPLGNYFDSLSFHSLNRNLHSKDWYNYFVAFVPFYSSSTNRVRIRAIINFDLAVVRSSPPRKNNALPKLIFAKLIARGYFSIIPKEISASHCAGAIEENFPLDTYQNIAMARYFHSEIWFYFIEFHKNNYFSEIKKKKN